ncbi:MAG: DMT family transporter [Rhodospirillales bacterium]|nr:DMT family transporter [Rhodospirillales bacterium]MDP6805294.1 DMT family transporter [Rhodospirillales bacterium]
MGAAEWGLLVVLSILWGGSFFFVEVALEALPPFTVVAARLGLAALALNAAFWIIGRGYPRDPAPWFAFFVMGLVNNVVPFCLIVWGQSRIEGGLASVLNATTPLFTVVIAHLLTRDERMTPGRVAGVALGIAGVVVVVGPDALQGAGANVAAQLAVLGAAISYALAGVFGLRFARLGVAPLEAATGQVTAGALMLIPFALFVDRAWGLPVPGADVWAALLGLGLLSTALGYLIYFRILARAGATNLLLVTFLVPVSAIALGTAILGERLAVHQLAGAAVIVVGLAAIDGRAAAVIRGWLPAGKDRD